MGDFHGTYGECLARSVVVHESETKLVNATVDGQCWYQHMMWSWYAQLRPFAWIPDDHYKKAHGRGWWVRRLSRKYFVLVNDVVSGSLRKYPPKSGMMGSMRIDCMPATIGANAFRNCLTAIERLGAWLHTLQLSTSIWNQHGAIRRKHSKGTWSDRRCAAARITRRIVVECSKVH